MVVIIDKINEVCNFYRLTDLNDKLEYLTWLYPQPLGNILK